MPASGGPRSSFVVSAARVSTRSTGFSHRVGVSSDYLAPALRFALRREWGSVGSALPLPPPCWYQSTLSLRKNPPIGVERNTPNGVCALVRLGSTIWLSSSRVPSETPPPQSGLAFLFMATLSVVLAHRDGAMRYSPNVGETELLGRSLRLHVLVGFQLGADSLPLLCATNPVFDS
jgi:hypothetical protein